MSTHKVRVLEIRASLTQHFPKRSIAHIPYGLSLHHEKSLWSDWHCNHTKKAIHDILNRIYVEVYRAPRAQPGTTEHTRSQRSRTVHNQDHRNRDCFPVRPSPLDDCAVRDDHTTATHRSAARLRGSCWETGDSTEPGRFASRPEGVICCTQQSGGNFPLEDTCSTTLPGTMLMIEPSLSPGGSLCGNL